MEIEHTALSPEGVVVPHHCLPFIQVKDLLISLSSYLSASFRSLVNSRCSFKRQALPRDKKDALCEYRVTELCVAINLIVTLTEILPRGFISIVRKLADGARISAS